MGLYRGLGGLGLPTYLWLAGNEGMEKIMETTAMGYLGTTILHFSLGSSQTVYSTQ